MAQVTPIDAPPALPTLLDRLQDWLVSAAGLEPEPARWLSWALLVLAVLAGSWLAKLVARRGIVRAVRSLSARTRTQVDDELVRHRVFEKLSHLAPALVIWSSAHLLAPDSASARDWIQRLGEAYMILVGGLVGGALLRALTAIYERRPRAREQPIKSYVQVVAILMWLLVGILVVARLLDKDPSGLITGLGALTAVLLLVFKDSILGFVASLHLAANDMVRRGDWIEMPKYGADGDVIDVSLATVKVRNWDKTITTIPTYALMADSFKNWRGMSEAGGRRIKRALRIDLHTIRFLEPEDVERLSRIQILKPYLEARLAEVERWNQEHGADPASPVNGRRLTNIGTFRAYCLAWLRTHPLVHEGMTLLVRQLPPDAQGLPLEIYVFSRETRWVPYEAFQADLFDHLLAALPEFGLRVHQIPSGADLRLLARVGLSGSGAGGPGAVESRPADGIGG